MTELLLAFHTQRIARSAVLWCIVGLPVCPFTSGIVGMLLGGAFRAQLGWRSEHDPEGTASEDEERIETLADMRTVRSRLVLGSVCCSSRLVLHRTALPQRRSSPTPTSCTAGAKSPCQGAEVWIWQVGWWMLFGAER